MHGKPRLGRPVLPERLPSVESVSAAYDWVGDDYLAYADGDPERLFSFESPHAYADRQVWSVFETKLHDLRASGASSVSILDAGCGPGTWLRRLVTQARGLGFSRITARGFDVAQNQIQTARRMTRNLTGCPGVDLAFDVADLKAPLPEADASVDITICLYSVLSHLPMSSLPKVAAEIARVTKGYFITTVRPIGSTPTIFVDTLEKARYFQLDHALDRCDVELNNGRRIALPFHLFTAKELTNCFAGQFDIEDLCGLDIFHNRFLPDPRWNPTPFHVNPQLSDQLAELEQAYARDLCFRERASHLLLVARRSSAAAPRGEHPDDPAPRLQICDAA
jgi:SAM-dependent methyltransferase